jgi:4-hydroxy-4-methyl-2-oxoglutarate aldolase
MTKIPEKLSDNITEKAKRFSSSLLSDAMERTGSMDYKIKPLTGKRQLVGTAFTVRLKPGDNLYLHQAIYSAQPGHVLVVDGKGNSENAYLGELMALAARERGITGIIIDGLIRDKGFLETMDFPIFAKGFIPNGPFKEGPGELNVTVSCGGTSVIPGDLVFGDEDGVVIVPHNKIEEVFTKAEKKLAYEKNRIEEINQIAKNKKDGIGPTELPPPSWLAEMIK